MLEINERQKLENTTKMSKKLHHQLNTEDLLNALESTEESVIDTIEDLTSYKNDVPLFLSKFKLEAGTFRVHRSIIYKLYRLFSEAPLGQSEFMHSCRDFIPKDDKYFNTNISPITLKKMLDPPKKTVHMSSIAIKKHYETFLELESVKKGTKWVEGALLYELYRFYCIDNNMRTRLTYKNFSVISQLYFETRRVTSSRVIYFKLGPETLNKLPPEHQQKVRNDRIKEKEKKRKIINKVSSVKS